MNVERITQTRPEPSERDAFLPSIDLGEVLRETGQKLLRNWRVLAAFMTVSIGLSVYYVLTATPLYTANGALLIDPRVGQSPASSSQMSPVLISMDELTVDSELRVLTSREVTTQTMIGLGFGSNPDTASEPEDETGPSLRDRVTTFLGLSPEVNPAAALSSSLQEDRRREAQRREFVKGLEVKRAGDSYVIDVSYTSPDLAFAPRAVNSLMQEFIDTTGQQQVAVVERTRDWLLERISELAVSVRVAETAVAEFRGANELVALQGELLPTQIALNSAIEELIRLRSTALVVDVQVEQLSEQIEAGAIEAVQIPGEERSPALEEFQTRYAELRREERELLISWDEDAPIVLSTRQQQEQIRSLILDEYRQVRDRLAGQGESLARQSSAIDAVIVGLRTEYGEDTRQSVELRNLEREAESQRELYERLLEEYNSSSGLLTFDATSARVIAWAVPPDRKSSPQSRQIVLLAAFGGLVLALGVILIREALDGSFRTYADVKRDLELNFLGVVPSFASEKRAVGFFRRLTGTVPGRNNIKGWQKLSRAGKKLSFTSSWPASVSAETMRGIQVQLMLQKGRSAGSVTSQIVGVTSTMRDEGKTTTSFNFAAFLASQGVRVAVVDLDLISQSMSRLLEPVLPSSNTLSRFLEDPQDAIEKLEMVEAFPNLAVIGNVKRGSGQPSAMRDVERIEEALSVLKNYFEFIIVDLPPVQGPADTRLLATLCDDIIYVVRWGFTLRSQVKAVFAQRRLPKDKILGVLFSRAKLSKYRWYNNNENMDYYG